MVAISNNDLRQLLLYVQATSGKVRGVRTNRRLYNRSRLAVKTVQKLMKRQHVQLIINR